MIFKEKFLDLAHPFFSMNELDDDATEEIFEKYYEVEGRIELLKKKLADLAEGDQAALDVLTAFLSDENSTRFLQSEKANAFLKILALASNITSDTWNKDAADAYPIRAVFLTEDNGIDPPYSASGTPLTNFFFNSDDVVNSVGFVDFRTDPDSNRLARQATWSPQGRDTVEVWTVILLLENIDNVDGCVAIFSSQGDAEKARSYLMRIPGTSAHGFQFYPRTDSDRIRAVIPGHPRTP
ncbi:hypothetical protein SAMN04488056_111194 [Cohaesibacter marisflavi]|uniref:Uncharacterized protein n=1 Tax=Cohaesibacter marisflavi TaxID=655353 RepID=A0A1I5JJ17_9HYPH|nr:hypothetical protein [Cohaesibacter marisflavi]SFO72818.1 hypothetical protein SAMN04488056_111194 [Cohaesibacter marisflavi]